MPLEDLGLVGVRVKELRGEGERNGWRKSHHPPRGFDISPIIVAATLTDRVFFGKTALELIIKKRTEYSIQGPGQHVSQRPTGSPEDRCPDSQDFFFFFWNFFPHLIK